MGGPPELCRWTESLKEKVAEENATCSLHRIATTEASLTSNIVDVFTDGACSGNPGPGGWAAILRFGAHEKEIFGSEAATTNNRMEITAVIEALQSLRRPSVVRIHTDSRYVMDGATQWLTRWKANGWKTADKKPVKNVDLWRKLDSVASPHTLRWEWVAGHSGHPENERADALARAAVPQPTSG